MDPRDNIRNDYLGEVSRLVLGIVYSQIGLESENPLSKIQIIEIFSQCFFLGREDTLLQCIDTLHDFLLPGT